MLVLSAFSIHARQRVWVSKQKTQKVGKNSFAFKNVCSQRLLLTKLTPFGGPQQGFTLHGEQIGHTYLGEKGRMTKLSKGQEH